MFFFFNLTVLSYNSNMDSKLVCIYNNPGLNSFYKVLLGLGS